MISNPKAATVEELYGKVYPLPLSSYGKNEIDHTIIPFSLVDYEYASENRAFHIYEMWPGHWGYMNKMHELVIEPQFAFSSLFRHDRAIVARGKFEYREDWKFDESSNNNSLYKGFWTAEEKWGVIDSAGKEIVPCIYEDVSEITNEWSMSFGYRIVRATRNGYQEAALFNMETGETIIDFGKYSDFGWPDGIDEYGQTLIATGGSLEHSENVKVGVLDVQKLEELIKPQYDYVEIEGYHLYLAGEMDEDGNEKNGALIDHHNQRLIDRDDISIVWDMVPADKGLRLKFFDQSESTFKIIKDSEGSPVKLEEIT